MSDEQRAEVLARSLDERSVERTYMAPESQPDGTVGRGDARVQRTGSPDGRELAPPPPPNEPGGHAMDVGQPVDPELADVMALAAQLQRLGPPMALIASAEASFDPAFAQRLKGTVLAAHVATYGAGSPVGRATAANTSERLASVEAAPAERAVTPAGPSPSPISRRSAMLTPGSSPPAARVRGTFDWWAFGRGLRALWGLLVLAAVAIAVAVIVALNVGTPLSQRAAARATATAALRPFLLQRNASSPSSTRSAATPSRLQPAATSATAAPGAAAAPVPASSALAGAGFQPPAASGSAPRPSVVPSVDLAPSARGTAAPRGTTTPGPDFGFYSTLSPPLADDQAAAATIPIHYRVALLPSPAPSYALSPRPLSAAAVRQIVASFPALRRSTPTPLVLGQVKAVRYTAGAEQLEIVLATGEIRYSRRLLPVRAAGGLLTATAAQAAATRWLATHEILPAGIAARASMLPVRGGAREVRFVPALPHPLQEDLATSTVIALWVRLDGAGRVLAAERLWPSLLAAPAALLPPLPRSIPAPSSVSRRAHGAVGGASKGPTASVKGSFEVMRLEIVYTASGAGRSTRLRPGYLLLGRLAVPGGGGRPYSLVVAGAAPPEPLPASPTRAPTTPSGAPNSPTATHP